MIGSNAPHIVVVGAGFCGLAAAYELQKRGARVTILEGDDEVGGLAGTFEFAPEIPIEKFYHHWFTSDSAILSFIEELGLSSSLRFLPSKTGIYYANSTFRLSSPLDLLRFSPLPFLDRIRTGLMSLRVRQIKDWRELEHITAFEWIEKVAGRKSMEVIWKPLLEGKFGEYAPEVSAVWLWNKLKLRGSSRDAKGSEQLVYYEGSFGALTDQVSKRLKEGGAEIKTKTRVVQILDALKPEILLEDGSRITSDAILATVPLPEFLKLHTDLHPNKRALYSKIPFLGNVCLMLELSQSLSEMYWLNVTDPDFPFVGIIEHTQFDKRNTYGGSHLVYLSKYVSTNDPLYQLNTNELVEFSVPFLTRMFPNFTVRQIKSSHLWKAEFSQPIVVKNYSDLIPPHHIGKSLWLSTMAQIYPEDRGTNFAVMHGRKVASLLMDSLTKEKEEAP